MSFLSTCIITTHNDILQTLAVVTYLDNFPGKRSYNVGPIQV